MRSLAIGAHEGGMKESGKLPSDNTYKLGMVCVRACILYSPDWSRTYHVDQVDLKLTEICLPVLLECWD